MPVSRHRHASIRAISKSQVSRWENGHVVPERQYRRLLREVYGLDDRDLGFDGDVSSDLVSLSNELRARLARAARLDASTLTVLVAQTDALRQLDRVQGATYVLDQLRAHIDHLETLRHHSTTPDLRIGLSATLSDASSLAGWQALDMGALDQAWQHFERAKDAGREVGSAPLGAFALAEQAFVLLDVGELESAAEQLDHAINHCKSSSTPRLRAWLYATRAEMAAGAGHQDACMRDLDRADAELPDGLSMKMRHTSCWTQSNWRVGVVIAWLSAVPRTRSRYFSSHCGSANFRSERKPVYGQTWLRR